MLIYSKLDLQAITAKVLRSPKYHGKMSEPWQDTLQDIKNDLRLLKVWGVVIIILTSVILGAFVGWVIYFLLCVQKRLRCLAGQIESHSLENIPNSTTASPPTFQQQPSEEIKKLPERPVTRDLVEALAEKAVKTGRWQTLETSTKPTEDFPMKPMSSNKRVRNKGFPRTRSELSSFSPTTVEIAAKKSIAQSIQFGHE